MNLSENNLEFIIKNIINKIMEENIVVSTPVKKITYVVFNEQWDNRYYILLEELKQIRNMKFNAVLLCRDSTSYRDKIEEFYMFEKILTIEEFFCENELDIVIFPVIKRNEIINISNCINNTGTTEIVKRCFENGNKIYLLKSGIEKLTGKEPEKYKEKILNYYKQILEFDIEIIDNLKVVM